MKYTKEILDNEIQEIKIIPELGTDETNIVQTDLITGEPIQTQTQSSGSSPEPILQGNVNEGTAPKKETRGRKKGVPNKVKGTEVKAGEIDLSQYKPVEIPNDQQQQQQQVDIAKYVSGGLLLIMIDSIIPTVITIFYPKLKDLKDKKAIRLTKEEREELKPLADEAIKSLSLQMTPLEGFLLTLSFMYAGKVFALDESDYKTPVKSKS
jgi:hypothetical protein